MQFSNLNSIKIHLHTTLHGKAGISNRPCHTLEECIEGESDGCRKYVKQWQGLIYHLGIYYIPILVEVLNKAKEERESVVWEFQHHNFGGEKVLDQVLS